MRSPTKSITILLLATSLGLLTLFALSCGGSTSQDDGSSGSTRARPQASEGQASITVDSTADDDSRDGSLTLREAILVATGLLDSDALSDDERGQLEGSPGDSSADIILFDAKKFPSAKPATIELESPLPTLNSDSDEINSAGVIIDGSLGDFTCFQINSEGNSLKGLIIQNCRTAILIDRQAIDNSIGGTAKGEGNVISDNTVGIEIRGQGTRVVGNLIGTDPTGTNARPNEFEGIWIAPGAKDNIIGGTSPEERNLISGNPLFGISVDGTTGNMIIGNYIGTNITGSAIVGNKYGVIIQNGSQDNIVGGEGAAANVVSGNNTGIILRNPETSGNLVTGNYLGTDPTGSVEIRNSVDIWVIEDTGQNTIEGNITFEP